MRAWSVFILGCLFVVRTSNAINFFSLNLVWQYDPFAPIKAKHRVYHDSYPQVFLSLKSDSLKQWEVSFLVQNGYESEKHREISPEIDTLSASSQESLVQLGLSNVNESLLVIKLSRGDLYLYYDVNLKIGTMSFPGIYPVNDEGLPLLTNYASDAIQWVNSDATKHVQVYVEDFKKADPPMADMKPLAPSIPLDTSFNFQSALQLDNGYFYTVRKDSASSVGTTLLGVPIYYPKFRKIDELAESMFYLTTDAEELSLLRAANLKSAFDSFWLNTYGSQFRARNAIKSYYDKIELANQLFTDFKQGWKTDRGMIITIFGLPDEVYRQNNLEEWYYDEGYVFEFNVISTFFANRTYALRRKKSLEDVWYERIASIRQGTK
jgi:GWxTD domain-containing protein